MNKLKTIAAEINKHPEAFDHLESSLSNSVLIAALLTFILLLL